MEKEKNQDNEIQKEPSFFQKNILFIILLITNIIPIYLHADYIKTDMIVHWVLVIISIVAIILQSIKKFNQELVSVLIICMFFAFTSWDSDYNHSNYKAYKQVELEDALDYFYTSEYYDGKIIQTFNFEKYAMVITDEYIVTIDNKGIQSAYEYDPNHEYDIDLSTLESYDYDDAEMKMQELQTWFYCYVEDDNAIEYISIVGKKENNSKYPTVFEKKEYYIGQKDQEITEEYLINFEQSLNGDYYDVVDCALINQKGISGVVVTKPKEENDEVGISISVYNDQLPMLEQIGYVGYGGFLQILDDTCIKVDGTTVYVGPLLYEDDGKTHEDQLVATYDEETQRYDIELETLNE